MRLVLIHRRFRTSRSIATLWFIYGYVYFLSCSHHFFLFIYLGSNSSVAPSRSIVICL